MLHGYSKILFNFVPQRPIAILVGICENTLRNYFELYQQDSVDKLRFVSQLFIHAPAGRQRFNVLLKNRNL
jgi:hypothetical protein